MTVPEADQEGQKMHNGPTPGNPHHLTQNSWDNPHSLAYEINPAPKNWLPHILEPLAFPDGPHYVYGVCISLNKPSFIVLWLTLEFFPAWSHTWWSSQGLT